MGQPSMLGNTSPELSAPIVHSGPASFAIMLRCAGFVEWFTTAAGDLAEQDPWAAFDAARLWRGQCPQSLSAIVILFVAGGAVTRVEGERALGRSTMFWLLDRGVLRIEGDRLRSAYCLLARANLFILANWPLRTAAGRLVCRHTYLSAGSYDCAAAIEAIGSGKRALDLGCGGGILTAVLAQLYGETRAVDIDPGAVSLTRLNLELNDLHAAVRRQSWDDLNFGNAEFDLIVSNPPWRIVPGDVHYPDAVARVGCGLDGLDQVRRVLVVAAQGLAPHGRAIVRFDLPHGRAGSHPLEGISRTMAAWGVSIEFQPLCEIDIAEQARTSANACAHLNPNVLNLADRFAQSYSERGITRLEAVLCHLTRSSH